jgi:hypothetical protein
MNYGRVHVNTCRPQGEDGMILPWPSAASAIAGKLSREYTQKIIYLKMHEVEQQISW